MQVKYKERTKEWQKHTLKGIELPEKVAMMAFVDELQKIAESTYIQDFKGGMDPFGIWTSGYGYGAQKAGLTKAQHAKKRAVATAGGVVGGAILIPSAITGIVEGAKSLSGGWRGAAKGFLRGAAMPYKALYDVTRARGVAKKVMKSGGKFTPKGQKIVGKLGDYVPVSTVTGSLGGAKVKSGVSKSLSHPEIAKVIHTQSGPALKSAVTQLGLAGGVGGTSAYIQYGQGKKSYLRAKKDFKPTQLGIGR